jgi:predicted phage baseplate assembly protein
MTTLSRYSRRPHPTGTLYQSRMPYQIEQLYRSEIISPAGWISNAGWMGNAGASPASTFNTRFNPPGRMQLSYRVGTYTTVLERLIAYLTTHVDPDSGVPVLRLDTGPHENWLVGLLQAWSMVIDVLTFYQERIANEGYLRTAIEQRSVMELTRTIGYELRPGVSAGVYLAFSVRTGRDDIAQRVLIPARAAVQSVPTQGQPVLSLPTALQQPPPVQLPQIFETSASFEARPEWNAITPSLARQFAERTFRPGVTSLRLAGMKTGLRAGDTILITGSDPSYSDQNTPWIFAHLTAVTPNAKKGYTQVTWEQDARSSSDPTPIRAPAVFALRQTAKLYSYTRGGVRYSPLDKADWSPASIGLPNSVVYALVQHPTGSLLAATDQGVFRSQDQGASWQTASTGLMKMKVRALTVTSSGKLYAGTTSGSVLRSVDNGDTWQMLMSKRQSPPGLLAFLPHPPPLPATLPKTTIYALTSYVEHGKTCLAAAVESGVFTSCDEGASWQQSPSDVPGPDTGKRGGAWVFAAPAVGKQPLVGMDTGVFTIDSNPLAHWDPWQRVGIIVLIIALALLLIGAALNFSTLISALAESVNLPLIGYGLPGYAFLWRSSLWLPLLILSLLLLAVLLVGRWLLKRSRISTLPAVPFHALTFQDSTHAFAGNHTGIFRSQDGGKHWTGLQHNPSGSVQVLTGSSTQSIFAGTDAGSIFQSHNGGDAWEDFSSGLHLDGVNGLLAGKDGLFAVGAPDSSDGEDQWSRIQLQQRQIDLDKLYPTIAPGSWLVLSQNGQTQAYKIASVATSPNRDYRKNRDFTSVYVEQGDGLSAFARSATSVFAQSEPLALFGDEPVQGHGIVLSTFVPDLGAGQRIIVSGKRMRLRLVHAPATPPALVSADGLQQTTVSSEETLTVMAAPTTNADGQQRWLLRDRNNFIGSFTAAPQDVSYEPADDQDATVGELVSVQALQQAEQTTLLLDTPLQNVYDRSSVTIYANVVYATHGQTIMNEVLGSASTGKASRRYQLKQKPLTYTSSVAAESDQPDTLTVLVNQIPWRQVDSFHDLTSDERIYIVRHDDQDNTSIIFGNGEQGAHLPSGREHITATYRVGGGAAGNVPANSLTLLRTRPPGIQRVTNPIAASGGVDRESADEARTNAPRHVQTMQRVVSLSDYERFAQIFASISKVQVRALWNGHTRLVYMTVAGEGGQEIAEDSATATALHTAIYAASASPSHPLRIASFEPLYAQLSAALIIAPAYEALTETVLANVQQALTTTFGFDQRELGQSMAAAEVIATIQDVAGVVAVRLESLYLKGQSPALHHTLFAQSGRLDAGTLRPAQLIMLEAQSITLNVDV